MALVILMFCQNLMNVIEEDGYAPTTDLVDVDRIMRGVEVLCLTDEIHPIEALKRACTRLDLLDDLYYNRISLDEYVLELSSTENDLIMEDPVDEKLTEIFTALFFAILATADILSYQKGLSVIETIELFNEHDIWANIACGYRFMIIDTPWNLAQTFVYWLFKNKNLYTSWNEIHQQSC